VTLTELRYIVAVARERHFGRAAEACFVSQPTLSVAVKKLEEELGVMLFERGPGEVSVTPPGQKIVEQAQRVLEEAARVRELAAAGRDPLVGPLRLGAIYTIGPYLLPKLVPIMRRTAPSMPLHIQENFTHRLSESLKSGDVDVILIALPFDEPGIATRAVYDEPFLVAVPKGHEWEGRKRISSEELTRESLLLLGEGHCFRDQVLDICHVVRGRDRSALAKTVEGGSLETIRQMVASSPGGAAFPAPRRSRRCARASSPAIFRT
jgi:LysR family hydrogen peroxide-inducible transcriptional activator